MPLNVYAMHVSVSQFVATPKLVILYDDDYSRKRGVPKFDGWQKQFISEKFKQIDLIR